MSFRFVQSKPNKSYFSDLLACKEAKVAFLLICEDTATFDVFSEGEYTTAVAANQVIGFIQVAGNVSPNPIYEPDHQGTENLAYMEYVCGFDYTNIDDNLDVVQYLHYTDQKHACIFITKDLQAFYTRDDQGDLIAANNIVLPPTIGGMDEGARTIPGKVVVNGFQLEKKAAKNLFGLALSADPETLKNRIDIFNGIKVSVDSSLTEVNIPIKGDRIELEIDEVLNVDSITDYQIFHASGNTTARATLSDLNNDIATLSSAIIDAGYVIRMQVTISPGEDSAQFIAKAFISI